MRPSEDTRIREGEIPVRLRSPKSAEPRFSSELRPGGSLARLALPLPVMAVMLGVILLFSTAARAEHFTIELTVKSAQDQQTAHSDTDPPPQGSNPRPVCHVKRGEDLTLQFFFTSDFPHAVIRNVRVCYYIAPIEEAGKQAMPERGKPRLLEGTFDMDFKPDTGKVGLRQRLHIDQPGVYLVRIESQHSDSDHEHFAALDLIVE